MPPPESSKPSSSSFEGDFAPGEVLIGRYRVIALVGAGGMGQVYLADDLVLGQPVALKFLPEHLAEREGGLERFRAEVRHAREVTHPNVARVHDIGEVGGRHFLTMEFVDGEDLASLVKRIGRLPREYFGSGVLLFLLLVAMVTWAYRSAVGGRSAFGGGRPRPDLAAQSQSSVSRSGFATSSPWSRCTTARKR